MLSPETSRDGQDGVFVGPELVPYLEKWTRGLVADWLARNEGGHGMDDADWDANDIVIFDGFVLPVLEKARGKGFHGRDMDRKGFGFLMANVRSVILETVPTEDRAARGGLAKLGYGYRCGRLLEFVGHVPAECLHENRGTIKLHLDEMARINALRP